MVLLVLSIIYLAGIFQGIIICIALLRRQNLNLPSNRILILLITSMMVVILFYFMIVSEHYLFFRVLSPLSTASWFAIGPLFYLYVKSVGNNHFKWKLSFLPMFLFTFYNLFQVALILFGIRFGFNILFQDMQLYTRLWLFAYLIHGVIFTILTINILNRSSYPSMIKLKPFFYIFLLALILIAVTIIFKSNDRPYVVLLERMLVAVFAIFVLYLGLKSIQESKQFNYTGVKYNNSRLNTIEMKGLLDQLNGIMKEQKLYLDKDLSLSTLAKKSFIREGDLSQIFSQYLNSGFYDYIKEFRLQEVELRLKEPKYTHLKVEAIASDSGFKSRAAFYKAFKEKHGYTPSQYIKNS